MITYEAFKNSCLDLSILGLQDEPFIRKSRPINENAKVLAWLADAPGYFCQLPDQGHTVFAVDPNGLPGEKILPVAGDIGTFISLLICCKDAALIAGAYQWSSVRFQELTQSVALGMKAQSVLRALENIYHPPVIREPYALMAQLQKEYFASSQDADWKVCFDTDFYQSPEKSGKELPVNRGLSAQEGLWHVPSVYFCDGGIVVDAFLEVSADSLESFHMKWACRNEETLSMGDKLQRYLDDPLAASVSGILSVNDKPLRCKSSYSAVWNPLEDNRPQVRRILRHYHLNLDQGYLFRRYCFLRKGKYPLIRTMQLTLEAIPVMVPDESFVVDKDGMRFRFIHPSTGLEHTFTALSLTKEALNPNFLTNHPCFYSRLVYALEPSISPENFRVVDRNAGDYWDGYQDDPAALVYANQKPDPGRYALSSLYYEPQNQVQWQIIFRRKLHQDIHLKLLP